MLRLLYNTIKCKLPVIRRRKLDEIEYAAERFGTRSWDIVDRVVEAQERRRKAQAFARALVSQP